LAKAISMQKLIYLYDKKTVKKIIYIWAILAIWLTPATIYARIVVSDTAETKKKLPPVRKFYAGTALDGALLSTALIQKTITQVSPPATSTANSMAVPRVALFLNIGFTLNLNLSRHIGLFTGLDLKNLGYIDKNAGGETVKRRTYNLGAPLGIKIGNMVDKKNYFFTGGGADYPINYREKTYVIRDQKTKFSEWFSARTPSVMPYVFAGFAVTGGFTIKGQYYPADFLNTSFTTKSVQPYAGTTVHILLLSLGYAVPFTKQKLSIDDMISELNGA